MGAYRQKVVAEEGVLLLGGVPSVESSWFQDEADANAWADVVVAGNQAAGRACVAVGVQWSKRAPEIGHCQECDWIYDCSRPHICKGA